MSNKIAIIGGSGLENPKLLKNSTEVNLKTPYGNTSSTFKVGTIGGVEVVLLSRHGRKHTIPPTQVNNRANIWAIKELGCSHILATTACGSLRKKIDRGHFIIPDQFIDFTKLRKVSFHDEFKPGEMAHTPMADPFHNKMREILINKGIKQGLNMHKQGTVITIEGPRFSTRAESNMFRAWGADIINMSTAPEAILANELGLPYAAMAMATDYDCWKLDEQPVTWQQIVDIFKENVSHVLELIQNALPEIAKLPE